MLRIWRGTLKGGKWWSNDNANNKTNMLFGGLPLNLPSSIMESNLVTAMFWNFFYIVSHWPNVSRWWVAKGVRRWNHVSLSCVVHNVQVGLMNSVNNMLFCLSYYDSHIYCAKLDLKTFVFVHLRYEFVFIIKTYFFNYLIVVCLHDYGFTCRVFMDMGVVMGGCVGPSTPKGILWTMWIRGVWHFFISFSMPWLSKVNANPFPKILEGVEIFCIIILYMVLNPFD